MARARLDPVAVTAAVLALAMLVVYLSIIWQQDGEPAAWAVAALIVGAPAAGYGAVVTFPYRRASLLLAGLVLVVLVVLARFSIGLPILVAGALCLVAVMRQRSAPTH